MECKASYYTMSRPFKKDKLIKISPAPSNKPLAYKEASEEIA
jgi:hypothetical protein